MIALRILAAMLLEFPTVFSEELRVFAIGLACLDGVE